MFKIQFKWYFRDSSAYHSDSWHTSSVPQFEKQELDEYEYDSSTLCTVAFSVDRLLLAMSNQSDVGAGLQIVKSNSFLNECISSTIEINNN